MVTICSQPPAFCRPQLQFGLSTPRNINNVYHTSVVLAGMYFIDACQHVQYIPASCVVIGYAWISVPLLFLPLLHQQSLLCRICCVCYFLVMLFLLESPFTCLIQVSGLHNSQHKGPGILLQPQVGQCRWIPTCAMLYTCPAQHKFFCGGKSRANVKNASPVWHIDTKKSARARIFFIVDGRLCLCSSTPANVTVDQWRKLCLGSDMNVTAIRHGDWHTRIHITGWVMRAYDKLTLFIIQSEQWTSMARMLAGFVNPSVVFI